MQKLVPVEDAKALMREAADWSVWGWLTGKRKLRTTADAAWEALEETERRVKETWPAHIGKAHRNGDSELNAALQRVLDADAEWRTARETAEATFDEADRRMDTGMACQGALQAIRAWELAEQAIRRAEALARRAKP